MGEVRTQILKSRVFANGLTEYTTAEVNASPWAHLHQNLQTVSGYQPRTVDAQTHRQKAAFHSASTDLATGHTTEARKQTP
jgi:hypothetical protein